MTGYHIQRLVQRCKALKFTAVIITFYTINLKTFRFILYLDRDYMRHFINNLLKE